MLLFIHLKNISLDPCFYPTSFHIVMLVFAAKLLERIVYLAVRNLSSCSPLEPFPLGVCPYHSIEWLLTRAHMSSMLLNLRVSSRLPSYLTHQPSTTSSPLGEVFLLVSGFHAFFCPAYLKLIFFFFAVSFASPSSSNDGGPQSSVLCPLFLTIYSHSLKSLSSLRLYTLSVLVILPFLSYPRSFLHQPLSVPLCVPGG